MSGDLIIGSRLQGSDGTYRYPEQIRKRNVTALNGATADNVPMDMMEPHSQLKVGPTLAYRTENWRMRYALGLNPENDSQRIAKHRYPYDNPAESTGVYEGSEVAYLEIKFGTQHDLDVGRRINLPQLPPEGSLFVNGRLCTSTVTYIQGTEAWNSEEHERVVSNERNYGVGLGLSYVMTSDSWEVEFGGGITELYGKNFGGTQYTMGLGINYKLPKVSL